MCSVAWVAWRTALLALIVATLPFAPDWLAAHQAVAREASGNGLEIVEFPNDYGQGAIVVRTGERRLYYTLTDRTAIAYRIAVGSPENQWTGVSYISAKRKHPSWTPTPSMRRKNPRLPRYVAPGPHNPLGVRALYLDWGMYRIHGTNAPQSIGRAVSNGCIRMHNADVIDLFERVHIGAPVFVEH